MIISNMKHCGFVLLVITTDSTFFGNSIKEWTQLCLIIVAVSQNLKIQNLDSFRHENSLKICLLSSFPSVLFFKSCPKSLQSLVAVNPSHFSFTFNSYTVQCCQLTNLLNKVLTVASFMIVYHYNSASLLHSELLTGLHTSPDKMMQLALSAKLH